ncbi:MAG: hypothetical protein ACXW5W_04750, partial [Candidatus Binatia bacterium]
MIIVPYGPFSFRRNERQRIVNSFWARSALWHLPDFDDHPPPFLIKNLVVLKQNRALPASHYGNKCHNMRIASS